MLTAAAILQYATLLAKLVETGVLTAQRLRANAEALGATPEDLAALDRALADMDVELSDRIARRQAEHGGAG